MLAQKSRITLTTTRPRKWLFVDLEGGIISKAQGKKFVEAEDEDLAELSQILNRTVLLRMVIGTKLELEEMK